MFCRFAPLFELYSRYASGHNESVKKVSTFVEDKSDVTAWLEQARTSCDGSSLESLLIMPIQRVPRYSLLLREIIQTLPPLHPDYQELLRAANLVHHAAATINDTIRAEVRRKESK